MSNLFSSSSLFVSKLGSFDFFLFFSLSFSDDYLEELLDDEEDLLCEPL